MKGPASILFLLANVSFASSLSIHSVARSKDRVITEVVKLLQNMLDKAKTEGNDEEDMYAKFTCYVDKQTAEKKASIEQLTKNIALLEAKIEELKGGTGELSEELAKLKKDLEENEAQINAAGELREKEHASWTASDKDSTDAIASLTAAIQELSAVGADQSQSSMEHATYMANFDKNKKTLGKTDLALLKSRVQSVLMAASAFVNPKQTSHLKAFLQAPSYNAQSGEIVGILINMKDTFEANQKSAKEQEDIAREAHLELVQNLAAAAKVMSDTQTEKLEQLGSNDADLAIKAESLEADTQTKVEAEQQLNDVTALGEEKEKEYDVRVALRTQEQAALSEAIAILNSDAAFATFGSTKAASNPLSFVQRLSTVRRHSNGAPVSDAMLIRKKTSAFLQSANVKSSPLLGRIAALLQAGNPFATVLVEIDKMIDLIAKEEKVDKKQHTWCKSENETVNQGIADAASEIVNLDGEIVELDNEIKNPETGLLVQISNAERGLTSNQVDQQEITKNRASEHAEYMKNIANLRESEGLLSQAIKVLERYYAKIENNDDQSSLLEAGRKAKDGPSPPELWKSNYKGQIGDSSPITKLQEIKENIKTENKDAESTESKAVKDFEEARGKLVADFSELTDKLAQFRKNHAETKLTLLEKNKALAKQKEEKKTLEVYLEKIKPGCDFIQDNLAERKEMRIEEEKSLKGAKKLLKESPVYTEAMEDKHQESLGDCKETCNEDAGHAKCKACLAGVSVPGYCAGHADVPGC